MKKQSQSAFIYLHYLIINHQLINCAKGKSANCGLEVTISINKRQVVNNWSFSYNCKNKTPKNELVIEYFNSGYINFRSRKLGVIWSGETAQHLMDEHLANKTTHPFLHMKVQQLAKSVKEWRKQGDKRYSGEVTDQKTLLGYKIVVDIYPSFAILITAYKFI